MISGQAAVRSCLYHTALLPRTIRIPVSRQRPSCTTSHDPHWGERALIAMDVFDGSIRRAEALIARLHCNGYDIAAVTGKLQILRSLQRDLAFVFRDQRYERLEQLHDCLEVQFEEFCSAISSLERMQDRHHAMQCQNTFNRNERSFAHGAEEPVTCRHAARGSQHA